MSPLFGETARGRRRGAASLERTKHMQFISFELRWVASAGGVVIPLAS